MIANWVCQCRTRNGLSVLVVAAHGALATLVYQQEAQGVVSEGNAAADSPSTCAGSHQLLPDESGQESRKVVHPPRLTRAAFFSLTRHEPTMIWRQVVVVTVL